MVKTENNFNTHTDVYRPSETSRLQAQKKRDRLRNVQEKRRSLHETSLHNKDNAVPQHIRHAVNKSRKQSNGSNDDFDENERSEKKYASPFYDPVNVAEEEQDRGYESPEEAPRVMSPNSVLKHRGYSRIITGGDTSTPERKRNTENNILFPKQRDISPVPVVTRPRDTRASRKPSVRQILGEPVPLPYLKDNSIDTKDQESKVVNILTNNKLESKNKRVNQNFQRLISRNKENIARRLRELNLQHQLGEQPPHDDIPETKPVPSGNYRMVSGSHSGQPDFAPSRSLSNERRTSTDVYHSRVSSVDSVDNMLKEVDREDLLIKLQDAIDDNGRKLDIIMNILKKALDSVTSSRPGVSMYTILGTLCIIILLSFDVYLYMYIYNLGCI